MSGKSSPKMLDVYRFLAENAGRIAKLKQFVEQVGFENKEVEPRIMVIWEKYVSEKPRAGYRPLGLSISHSGTYFGEQFIDAEYSLSMPYAERGKKSMKL